MSELRLLDHSPESLAAILSAAGFPAYRAKQLYDGLLRGKDIDGVPGLDRALREYLKKNALVGGASIAQRRASAVDGTVKYLFELSDGDIVEGVLMRYKHGNTLCISTQIGCRMGCAFCASTLCSLVRNLFPGEMLGQVVAANRDAGGARERAITNVVLMGSGEPLDNYDNVVSFLRLLNDPRGLNISLRNVSLSTCGLVEGIDRLAGEGLPVTLAISLHAADDVTRAKLMPVARKYPIDQVVAAARRYDRKTGRRVIVEYALVAGVNDSPAQAQALCALLRGLRCHVNLIPVNRVDECGLGPPPPQAVRLFLERLQAGNISATIRRELGADIQGACGQLRAGALNERANRGGDDRNADGGRL